MTSTENEKKNPNNPHETKDNVSNDAEKQEIVDNSKKESESLKEQVKTKVDSDELKRQVEKERYWNNTLHTYEILEWTWLKEKMLKVLADPTFNNNPELKDLTPEQRLEKIFRKVNIVLTKFLEKKFNIDSKESIPSYISDVFVPATEWYLMDILRETWHENNVNFLWEITKLNVESISSLFTGINNFSKKFTVPYSRWKALLNAVDFISLPKNVEQSKKLKNPYEVYEKLLKNPIFNNNFKSEWENSDTTVNINTISRDQFDLTDLKTPLSQEELNKKLEEWKSKMKADLWSIQMVESPDTIKKILGVLDKTDSFMNSTKKLWDNLIDSIDSFWNMAQAVNNSFWFDARGLLKKLEKKPIIWWIISFVLSLLGFSWGIWGIEKAWKKKKIDRDLDTTKKSYIEEVYKNYMNNKQIESWTAKALLNNYWITVDSKYEDKFAIDIDLIKDEINKKIWSNWELINPSTLYSINTKDFKWKDYVEEIKDWNKKILKLKKTTFTDSERTNFIEWYIQTVLGQYKKKKKLENLKDADTLAFTLISWVTLNKDDVIDWVEAEVFLPSQFYEKTEWSETTTDNIPEEKTDNLNYWENLSNNKKEIIKWELEKVSSPLTTENIIKSSKDYNIPVEYIMAVVKNDSSYWTAWKWARTRNPWNVWNTDDWSERTFNTWQEWLDAATWVIKDRVEEYQKVYWKDKYPWIKNLLENRWPDWKWFIASQKNYKQPNEYRWNQAPYWAYMTAKEWPSSVSNIVKDLRNQLNEA